MTDFFQEKLALVQHYLGLHKKFGVFKAEFGNKLHLDCAARNCPWGTVYKIDESYL